MPEPPEPSKAPMTDPQKAPRSSPDFDDPPQALRHLGARAHQLRATTQAADHFNALDTAEDRNTGSWLISSAVAMSEELAGDIDSLARALKERPADAALQQTVAPLRVRAHQLHAAARAADHFLDQDTREDRETGSWLVAAALNLASKLAAEIDDGVPASRRAAAGKPAVEPHDAGLTRRMAAATAPVRGAA
jgi:hypothetical protein